VGRSSEKVSFELGVIREGIADGESGESSEDNDLLDSLCVRRAESVMERLTRGCLREVGSVFQKQGDSARRTERNDRRTLLSPCEIIYM